MYWSRFTRALKGISDAQHTMKTIMDLGCGEGVFLPTLSKNFRHVYGIDLKIGTAKKLKDQFNLNNVYLVEGDILSNPFKHNKFDAIFAISVFEHFKVQEELFDSIVKLLKPNGYLIFSSPTENLLYKIGRLIFGYQKPHDHYFSAQEISRIADKYLCQVKRFNGPIQGFPIFLSQYILYVYKEN